MKDNKFTPTDSGDWILQFTVRKARLPNRNSKIPRCKTQIYQHRTSVIICSYQFNSSEIIDIVYQFMYVHVLMKHCFFSPWTAWNARNWSLDLSRLLPLRSWGCRWAGMWAGVIGHTKCPVLPWCRCLDFLLHKFRQKPWSYFMLQDEKQEKEEREEAKKLRSCYFCCWWWWWRWWWWWFECSLVAADIFACDPSTVHQKHSEVSHVRGQPPMKVPGLQLYLVFVGQC